VGFQGQWTIVAEGVLISAVEITNMNMEVPLATRNDMMAAVATDARSGARRSRGGWAERVSAGLG